MKVDHYLTLPFSLRDPIEKLEDVIMVAHYLRGTTNQQVVADATAALNDVIRHLKEQTTAKPRL